MRLLITVVLSIVGMSVWAQTDFECLAKAEGQRFYSNTLWKKSNTASNIDLVYHRLELNIDPNQNDMGGSVTTHFFCLDNTIDKVSFDLKANMVVDSVLQRGFKRNFSRPGDVVEIDIDKRVFNELDSIQIFYHGDPTSNPYHSYEREKRRPKSPNPVLWTLSEPYGAHAWWPCKESLYDKIDSVDIFVSVPNNNRVASNGLLIEEYDLNDSQTLFHWKHKYPIATYLIAVAVSDYAVFSDWVHFERGDSLEILNYIFPEYVPSGREPAKETVGMMLLFDSLFGEYPFAKEKYGHAQFLRSGGMEHQTMSFMAGLDYGLIAHELAHQWFGNKITCGSWVDLWLNEGFATYLTYLAFEHLQNDSSRLVELNNIRRRALNQNNGSVFISDTLNVSRLFSGSLTYAKGAMLLHMLRWQIGDEAFFAGIKNYIEDVNLSYATARTLDLQMHLERSSGQNLNEFFSDWFYGEGYPTYQIKWRLNSGLLEIDLEQIGNSSVAFFDIPVPIGIYGPTKDTIIRLEPKSSLSSFSVPLGFEPDSIQFDPELWILAKSQIFRTSDIDKSIRLYPQPVTSTLYIQHSFNAVLGAKVYGLDGKLISDIPWENLDGRTAEIHVQTLAAGYYFIKIEGNNGALQSRFIKIDP